MQREFPTAPIAGVGAVVLDAERRVLLVRFHYVLVDYRCRLLGGTLASATDVTEARWAHWNELTGHGAIAIRPFTLSVIRKALDQVRQPAAGENEVVTRDPAAAERQATRQEEPFP